MNKYFKIIYPLFLITLFTISVVIVSFGMNNKTNTLTEEEKQLGSVSDYRLIKQNGGYLLPARSGDIFGSSTVNSYWLTATTTNLCFTDNTCQTTAGGGGGLSATGFTASDNLKITTTSATVAYGVATGYSIPLTASSSAWITLTNLSSTATGLTYTNTTGAFSLTAGYNIPLTASTSNWQTAYGWGNHAGLYPTYTYASSTYYLATNPSGYITGVSSSTLKSTIDSTTASTTPGETDKFAFSGSSLLNHLTWANIKSAISTWLSGLFVKGYTDASLTIASSSWVTTATTTIPMGFAVTAQTWSTVGCYFDIAGTSTVSWGDGTNYMNLVTATTTPYQITMATNNQFTENEKRFIRISPITGTPNYLTCTVKKAND